MPQIQQPMLAQDYDPEMHDRMFPLYASPKVDGIRAYIDNGTVWARSNKAIPNRWIQELLPLYLPVGVDVELGVGDFAHKTHFSNTSSIVMSDVKPISDLHVYILDYVEEQGTEIRRYAERITYIQRWWLATQTMLANDSFVWPTSSIDKIKNNAHAFAYLPGLIKQTQILSPIKLTKPAQVPVFLDQCLRLGYEGIVLRRPSGGYEFGRPAAKEGLLLRHKPLTHGEAKIIGFKELEHNDNERTTSPTGRASRSTSKIGKRLGSTLGSFLVSDLNSGVEFSVGGGDGLTQELRQRVWHDRKAYLGLIIRYSYLSVGTKHKPRQPKFTGFRDERDLV